LMQDVRLAAGPNRCGLGGPAALLILKCECRCRSAEGRLGGERGMGQDVSQIHTVQCVCLGCGDGRRDAGCRSTFARMENLHWKCGCGLGRRSHLPAGALGPFPLALRTMWHPGLPRPGCHFPPTSRQKKWRLKRCGRRRLVTTRRSPTGGREGDVAPSRWGGTDGATSS